MLARSNFLPKQEIQLIYNKPITLFRYKYYEYIDDKKILNTKIKITNNPNHTYENFIKKLNKKSENYPTFKYI